MPASLMVEQRKMIFYNKIYVVTILFYESCVLCIVMRHKNNILSSVYHVFLDTQSIRPIDIKRAVWSSFVRVGLLTI